MRVCDARRSEESVLGGELLVQGSGVLLYLIILLVKIAIREAAHVWRDRVRQVARGDQGLVGAERLGVLLG